MNEQKLKKIIRDIAFQLERWAAESKLGGWSTHQVKPMEDKAAELLALLGRLS